MNNEESGIAPIKERMGARLQHLLRRRERILRILMENENQIDTYRSNLDELNTLMTGEDTSETS